MKTLVTHINPHLDDIAAIWLFKKFHPDFANAKLQFLSQSQTDKIKGTETSERIFLGIGKGRFDEHKGDKEDCAASLVWKEIKSKDLVPKDKVLSASLDELVAWVTMVDLGRTPIQQFDEFTIPAFIRPHDGKIESSLEAVLLGGKILDRIIEVLKNKNASLNDWKKAVEFNSQFGKSFAVESDFINRSFCKSTGAGDLYIIYSPKYKSVEYFTPSFEIDLEPIYKILEKKEPRRWFLHHSHHMLLCGSGSAPDSKLTGLTFKQLIDIAKSV